MGITVKGRHYTEDCELCNEVVTEHFHVEDWEEVVPNELHKKVLCWRCYVDFRKKKGLKPLNYEDYVY